MDIDLELYRGAGQEYYGEYELDHVLRKAARQHFGDLPDGSQIQFVLQKPRDPEPYVGPPEVHNIARFGYCRLQLLRDGETVRDEELRIAELLGPVLAPELLDMEPDEARWSFIVRRRQTLAFVLTADVDALAGQLIGRLRDRLADQFDADERPAPEIEGAVDVDLSERRHQPFTLTPMATTEAELVNPADLGMDPHRLRRINILMPTEIHDQMLRTMELSDRIEEGGFLLGRVRRAAREDGDAHLVEVTHVTPAHRSGAGRVHFTFTGESFLAVARLIEERGEAEELVGWYHTHLPSVGTALGLSSIDVDLHLATFQRPWQVAALINLRSRSRLLRFYGRGDTRVEREGGGADLAEYEQWISDDSGRYRPAGHVVGGE